MTQQDRTTQHSANGVGGSNNPAANPGQDKPAKREGDQTGQKPKEGMAGVDSDKKVQEDPDKSSQR
jgi:hypothetical protein